MADKVLNITTGAAPWATAGSWQPSGVPVSGDRVFVKSGDSTLVITAASTQAAVVLADIVFLDSFLGTFNVDVAATLWHVGQPSGSTSGTSGSGQIVANNGSNAATVIVYKTGSSLAATSGLGAFLFTGTSTSNVVNVLAGSVDIGRNTDVTLDLSATKAAVFVQGGNVTIGANSTTYGVNVTGGTFVHNGLSDSSTGSLIQSGGQSTTYGKTKFPSIVINSGTIYANHRPASGDAAATVFIGSGATLNIQGDSRSFQVGTSITLNPGGSIKHLGLSQITGVAVTQYPGTYTAS